MPHDDFWTAASALAAVAYCVITVVTLVLLAVQVREARRATLAEFINNLGKEFAVFGDLFDEILADRDKITLPREQLLPCLRFFERVKTLSDVGVLDIALLDGVFGYQFFLLVNHAGTQERILLQGEHFFPEIFALHKQLSDYRRGAGYPLPFAENDLALKDKSRYKVNLDLYRQKRFRSKH
jgi:hypothetical protein